MGNENYTEQYGAVTLSYLVGSDAHCTPKRIGLPLRSYETVELGVKRNGRLWRPETPFIGLGAFELLWEPRIEEPVAKYVTWPDVDRIRCILAAHAGCELQEPTGPIVNDNPKLLLARLLLRVFE